MNKANKGKIGSFFERILEVCKFTMAQSLKNKTFIGMLVFTAIGVMGYVFYLAYSNNATTVEEVDSSYVTTLEETDIEGADIIDDNGLIQNILMITGEDTKVESFNNMPMSVIYENVDEYKTTFNKEKDNKNTLLVHIANSEAGYDFNVYTHTDTDITDEQIGIFTSMLENVYKTGKLASIGMDPNRVAVASTPVVPVIDTYKEKESSEDETFLANMMFSFVLVAIIYFIIQYCGNNISSQIITEKSTRLVESLLVSLKPLELIGGKILAGVALSIIQTLVMIISAIVGVIMCKETGMVDSYGEIISSVSLKGMDLNISVGSILLVILAIAVGFMFFGTLSGICASTVSKLEELSSANSLYAMFTLMGYMVAIVMSVSEVEVDVLKVLAIVPITSVFMLPTSILTGKLTTGFVVIAILIQIVIVALFNKLAAVIYEGLILHYGDKVKLKDMVGIIRDYIRRTISAKKRKAGGVSE